MTIGKSLERKFDFAVISNKMLIFVKRDVWFYLLRLLCLFRDAFYYIGFFRWII